MKKDKLRISFIWYFEQAGWVYPNWRDGLRAAIEEIEKKHEVKWFLDKAMPEPNESDFLLFWSSSNEDYFGQLDKYKNEKKGLCLTTDPHNVDNLKKLNIIFAESDPIYNQCRALGIPVIKAFGTDTDFYKPNPKVKKDIKYFYPATFSPWKRQRDIAYLGKDILCVGTLQPDGWEDFDACKKNGVQLKVGYFPAPTIKEYYDRTEKMILPAVHGSERTMLEAMACGILPEVVHPDINTRLYSYRKEFLDFLEDRDGVATTRDFVLERYSHKKYAEDLLKGIINA